MLLDLPLLVYTVKLEQYTYCRPKVDRFHAQLVMVFKYNF